MKKTFIIITLIFLFQSAGFNEIKSNFNYWYQLSNSTKDINKKIAYLIRSLHENPSNKVIYNNRIYYQIGELYEKIGDTERAEKMYKMMLDITENKYVEPPSIEPYKNLIAEKEIKDKNAVEKLPIDMTPLSQVENNKISYTAVSGKTDFNLYYDFSKKTDNLNLKIAFLLKSIQLKPGDPNLYFDLGEVLKKKGDIITSREINEKGVNVLLGEKIIPPALNEYNTYLPSTEILIESARKGKPFEQLYYEKAQLTPDNIRKKLYLTKALQINPDYTPASKYLKDLVSPVQPSNDFYVTEQYQKTDNPFNENILIEDQSSVIIKSIRKNILKSIVLPGWGQFCSGKKIKGISYFTLTISAIAYSIVNDRKENENRDNLRNAVTTADKIKFKDSIEDFDNKKAISAAAAGSFWIINIMDQILFGGSKLTSSVDEQGEVSVQYNKKF